MKQFKYILDPSSKKFVCPSCQKKTFVKFIDSETNNYLNDDFGRCDRQNECKYFKTPTGEISKTFKIVNTPPPEPSFHDFNLVVETLKNYTQNDFVQFLKTIFTPDEVETVIKKYYIGTSKIWGGATIFWQIDNYENVRHGKVMKYNFETCKRVKNDEGKALINSVRSLMKLKDFNLKQCLFGLHLINKNDTIGLVEGEKTAILMSVFKPQYKWLATGSESGFKYEYLKPIKNNKIVAFPDKGVYFDWLNKAQELNGFGFKIVVSDFLENTDYLKGSDLADVYIDNLKNLSTNENERFTDIRKQIEISTTENERIESEIKRIKSECKDLENTFIQASQGCPLEWFTNRHSKGINAKSRLHELIYWTS
jgi:hypothetical protein